MIYKSRRIGKGGKEFWMYKIQTLKSGSDKTMFAGEEYTRFGKFLRKSKLDEIPQLWNVLKGDMAIFGYRPEEVRTWRIIPLHIRKILETSKPGIVDLSSILFYNEGEILSKTTEPFKLYWREIKPMKFVLQIFYIENKSILLNLAIVWMVIKRMLKSLWNLEIDEAPI